MNEIGTGLDFNFGVGSKEFSLFVTVGSILSYGKSHKNMTHFYIYSMLHLSK